MIFSFFLEITQHREARTSLASGIVKKQIVELRRVFTLVSEHERRIFYNHIEAFGFLLIACWNRQYFEE